MNRSISVLFNLVVVVCLTAPRTGWAYGLGELELHSHLQQPLRAVIRLIGGGDADTLSAGLLPQNYYDEHGLMYVPLLQQAAVSIERQGNAQWLIVSTDVPVNEFLLDLAVELTHGRLTQIRHYTLLIDVAEVGSQTPASPPSPIGRADSQQQARPPQPSVVKARPVQAIERTGTSSVQGSEYSYGPVRTGESLWRISENIIGEQRLSLYELMDQMVTLNPHAFVNGDPNRLRVGATLQVPEMSSGFTPRASRFQRSVAARPQAQPSESARALDKLFEETRESSGPGPKVGPTASMDQLEIATAHRQDIAKVLDAWIETDDQTGSTQRAENIRRDLAIAAAEQETLDQENQQLVSQIQALEKRVTDLQQLLTLQDAVIEQRISGIEAQADPGGVSLENPLPASNAPSRTSYTTWIAALLGLIAAGALGFLGWHSLQWRRRYEQGPTLDIEFGPGAATQPDSPADAVNGIEVDELSAEEADWSEVLEAAALASTESQAALADAELQQLENALNSDNPDLQSPAPDATGDYEIENPGQSIESATHLSPAATRFSIRESDAAHTVDSEALLTQARALIEAGQHDDAESLLETVLREGTQTQRAEATYLFLEMS